MAAPAGASLAGGDARTVVLVRHGATPMTEAREYSGGGVPGPSLTTRGRTQAARAADAVFRLGKDLWPDLPRAGALVASPMLRTLETAGAVGRRIGRHAAVDERFAECVFGEWEGLPAAEIAARWPRDFESWFATGTHPAPGGESYALVGQRAWAGLRDVVTAAEPGSATVVVTHTVTIRALVGLALSAPPSTWPRLRVPPCSLSILRLGEGDGDALATAEVTAVGYPTDG